MRVCVAVYENKYGSNTRTFQSEEGAIGWRTEIAKENWQNEFPGVTTHAQTHPLR